MLRVVVTEDGGGPLPPVDVEGDFEIGSAAEARVRLPAGAGDVRVIAAEVGDGKTYQLGRYRVRVEPAPPGSLPATPQRTESLARELARGLLGANAAPVLEVERGPLAGARRMLAPPESVLVIGRGDEAGWIVDDKDLSRAHAEVRRGWDGVRVIDLGSKNGTRVEGRVVGEGGAELRDGMLLELGNTSVRFRDPAERHLRGGDVVPAPPVAAPPPASRPEPRGPTPVFYVAVAICLVALAGLVWIATA